MKLRIAVILLFAAAMIGAFVFFQFEDRLKPVEATESVDVTKEMVAEQYDQWWDSKMQGFESRLTYDTQMTVVHVGELNTDAYWGSFGFDLDQRHVSLNPETKAMYFYDQSYLPDSRDNMIVIHDVNSMDILLQERVYRDTNSATIRFSEIEPLDDETGSMVIEEARLYAGQHMSIDLISEHGDIEVEFDDQVQELSPGETAVFEQKADKNGTTVRSKVVVSNYGLWDSINMKYVVSDPDGGY
ncbi:hypothetical protein [Marinicrinis lubricantis]|uniref:Uncharacterized protein n=1 Tax=Marinicrinis lubricantis TaxID=2086470 RepID=A0ABW1IKU5_9BACL